MIGRYREQEIDQYILSIKKFYEDCSEIFNFSPFMPINKEESIYLNKNLNLEGIVNVRKAVVLNKILQDKTKYRFAIYLLETLSIKLEVNNIDDTKKSIFELLVENSISVEKYFFYQAVSSLYRRGYSNAKSDEKFLISFYKTKISNQQAFEQWSIARICFKLNNYKKIELALSKDKVLFSLLSFKLGKPIGFKYPNLFSVAYNALLHYREQGDLILYAMKYFKVYEDIKQKDKKGTFRLTENDFVKFKPIQDMNFNELAYEIFPELQH